MPRGNELDQQDRQSHRGGGGPDRTIVEKFHDEFEMHIRRQEPGRVERVLTGVNRAVYELPILGRRAAGGV
jgi:hypothetical protein